MDQSPIRLKGVTWGHTRGYVPLVATAQRYEELHPDVRISWNRRSLEDFSNKPLEAWVEKYDLVVIPCTWAGHAAETGILEPLDAWFSRAFLEGHEDRSIGHSHESYRYMDRQWALDIDASAPVASARPDLLGDMRVSMPDTWEELIVLAEQGAVIAPMVALDTLMHFYMLCASLGEEPCRSEGQVVREDIGLEALEKLRQLAVLLDRQCFDMNPIQVYEAMTQTDEFAYCPFAYGYSNYARPRYARRSLKFADLVKLDSGQRLRGPLGGAGLAISARSPNKWKAAEYAEFVAVSEIQKGYYIEFGGQPSFRPAWREEFANAMTGNYFADTLPALDRAFIRPRYEGHMGFQESAGAPIREFLVDGGNAHEVLARLNELYLESKS